jgi:hypothetical protein
MPVEVRVLPTAEATRAALQTLVRDSDRLQVAAAFVRRSGVEELQLLQRPPSRLQLIAGSDFGLTQIEALEALHAPPQRECRLYFTPEESEEGIFHPKLYLGGWLRPRWVSSGGRTRQEEECRKRCEFNQRM